MPSADTDYRRISSLIFKRDGIVCTIHGEVPFGSGLETCKDYPRTRYYFTAEGTLTREELFTETGILDPLDLL